MADKPTKLVCKAGEDPDNSRTKGAIATIYNNGVSVYHLSPKEARTTFNETGLIESSLHRLGLGPRPEPTFKSEGAFRHSQPLTVNGDPNPLRDPVGLRDGLEKIRADFIEGGTLKSCTIKSPVDGDISVPAVQATPKPNTPDVKVSAAPALGPSGMA